MSHPVVARLRDPDPTVRREACREAAEDPSAVLLIDALGEALGDPVPAVGRAASAALADLARRHDEVDDLLRRALRGDDARRRFGAAHTRALLGPPEPGLLPALVEAMADADAGVRWSAARIFVDLGRLHGEARLVAMGLARSDPSPVLRRMAIFCLGKLAPGDDSIAEELLNASRDEDSEVRRAALIAMAGLQKTSSLSGQQGLEQEGQSKSASSE